MINYQIFYFSTQLEIAQDWEDCRQRAIARNDPERASRCEYMRDLCIEHGEAYLYRLVNGEFPAKHKQFWIELAQQNPEKREAINMSAYGSLGWI